jgi:hypothetical protein
MKTTKAYLAGLGMAGMVIGSILVLLAVGTGVVGFDGGPNLGRSKHPLDRVVAGDHGAAGRGGARRVHPRLPWPVVTPATHGQRSGSRAGAEERRKRAATRRRTARRRTRSVAGWGFGGAESWTRERLGGGAALGAGAARAGRPGGSEGPAAGWPELGGGAIAPAPPPDPDS